MKKKLLIILSILFLLPISTYAINIDDYFIVDDEATIKEKTNHSVFISGNEVDTSNEVNGALFAAGNNVKVTGVAEYAFVAGRNISIEENVTKDLFAAGETVLVDSDVSGDVYLAGRKVIIKGNVHGTVFAAAQDVIIEGAVIDGNVVVAGEKVKGNSSTVIGKTLSVNKDAKIKGINENIEIERYKDLSVTKTKKGTVASSIFAIIAAFLIDFVTKLLLAFLLVGLLNKIYKYIVRRSRKANTIALEALKGFCFLVVVPFAFLLLLLTIIGMPIAIVLILMYTVFIIVASTLPSIYFGNRILTKLFKQKDNKFLSALIGVLVVSLLSLIPIVDFLVGFALLLIGLGILVDMGIAAFKYVK